MKRCSPGMDRWVNINWILGSKFIDVKGNPVMRIGKDNSELSVKRKRRRNRKDKTINMDQGPDAV